MQAQDRVQQQLQSSEREKQAIRDELTRKLTETQQQLRRKVIKINISRKVKLMDAGCRKKSYNLERERSK